MAGEEEGAHLIRGLGEELGRENFGILEAQGQYAARLAHCPFFLKLLVLFRY